MSSNVFFTKWSELEGRFDPQFYRHDYVEIIHRLKSKSHSTLAKLASFSTETWNQNDFFETTFPYIEISEIDLLDGKIHNIKQVLISEAPSRAKMIVRNGDIIVSTTRPSRGAISLIQTHDILIASTGFAVLRKIENSIVKQYLFNVLKMPFILKQFEQRSSGGNYPAITIEELSKVIIPVPPLHIQNEIIVKMDEAYRQKAVNEARAQAILDGIDGYLLSELGIAAPDIDDKVLSKRVFTRKMSEVSGKRFDPSAHLLDQIFSPILLEKSKYSLLALKQVVSFSKKIVSVNDDGLPYIGLENIESHTGHYLQSAEKQSFGTAFKFEQGYILFPKLRPYLNKIYMAAFDGICSTEFHVLQPLKNIDGVYLSEFLRSSFILEQTKRLMTGNTLPRLQTEDILNLMISIPPLEKQYEIADHIGSLRAKAKRLREEAAQQFEAAKAEVEKMVLGN
ncbi:MAG: restriction endonuclease subunit S [Sulfuricurvum sp.]|jgi:restriction endonuclease S subunit|nr:restriction endonuclease subunit S [Sulfuricurvum sp.]